jgi:hypothetical protein
MDSTSLEIKGYLNYALAFNSKTKNYSILPIKIAEILEYGSKLKRFEMIQFEFYRL